MKLKDIVPYCLQIKNGQPHSSEYYWIINGINYAFDSLQLDIVNFINLIANPNGYDYLMLNLNNEITIFDKFILVHKTQNETTNNESRVFHRQNYPIAYGQPHSAECYTIGLFHTTTNCMMVDLRTTIFKDLISPPVQSKPADLTLDERVDGLIDELMRQSKTMVIKKLKRMLNERL
jgi:hypothetical protein